MSEEPEVIPLPEPDAPPVVVPIREPDREPSPPEPEPLAETAAEIAQLDVAAPRVAIVVAGHDDLAVLKATEEELAERGIISETRVMSADEEPRTVAEYTENAQLRGIQVIVAGAGPAARLPTMIAAHTELPVIGVPLTSQGAADQLDELLQESPAPGAAPIAWVGLDDARAAAELAVRILGVGGRGRHSAHPGDRVGAEKGFGGPEGE